MQSPTAGKIATVFVLLGLVLASAAFAESNIYIKRDGNVFTLKAYMDVERSADFTWPYIWEFRHLGGYVDNVQEIDSLDGGQEWYDVKFTGDFPFVHTEVCNHKWIIEEGTSIGVKLIKSLVESPLPIAILASESYWRLESIGANRCRVHYKSIVQVDAAGMEVFFTGIARRDGKRIMKNFKRYVESQ